MPNTKSKQISPFQEKISNSILFYHEFYIVNPFTDLIIKVPAKIFLNKVQ